MEDIVRVGIVSAVDLRTGTAQVYYPDRMSTTGYLHLFAFRAEFVPPNVGDQVVVVHLSNDTSSGVILGRFWGEADLPPTKMEYRKDYGADAYEALANGTYMLRAPEISLTGTAGSITLSELIKLRERVEAIEEREG